MKNSESPGSISHEGVVQNVDEKAAIVRITTTSACSGCHAGGSCTLSGKEEKIIEITGRYNVSPGDTVTVLMKQSMGYAALLLGYLLPLVSVITILILLISLDLTELSAGLLSLTILIPYYSILYLFRKRINEKFTFTLKV
jgi:sigma-E factor negative regulatory protein RseC